VAAAAEPAGLRPQPSRRVRILLALAIGSAGGLCFFLLKLPLPWMIGAMVFTTTASAAGLPLAFSFRLRAIMVVVIGVMLGSAFTPALLDQIAAWLTSIAIMLGYVLIATLLVQRYLVRIGGYDRITAFFAAAPGGLTEMILTGGQLGGDERLISLSHGIRILLIAIFVSFGFRLFGGYHPTGAGTIGEPLLAVAPLDLAILAAAGVAGYFAAKPLRLAAGVLVGPMILSAVLHFAGVTASRPPVELVATAQIVLGTSIGARFSGTPARTIGRALLLSLGATVILLVITAGFALLIATLLGLPETQVLLAYSPGGIAEMSLIALSLGVDPAFVSTHHVARIFMIVMIAAPAFRLLGRAFGEKPKGAAGPGPVGRSDGSS
jgi:membrane AbrB-like protein